MTYICSYIVSIFLSHVASKSKGIFTLVLFGLVVLLLAAIFGFRDVSVGTDTKGYVSTVWSLANRYSDLQRYLQVIFQKNGIETLYALWNYGVSRLSNDFNVLLFTTGILLYGVFFSALYTVRKKIILPLAVYILLFCFFRESLNVLRQYLAIAFCMLSFSCLLEEKTKKGLFFCVVAYGFHHTSIIFFSIFLLKKCIDKYCIKMNSFKTKILLVALITVCLIGLAYILNIFESVGLIDARYSERYADSGKFGSNVPISLFAISVVNLYVFYSIKKVRFSKICVLFEYLLIIAFIFCFSGLISTFAVRMGTYFQVCTIFIFPYLYKNFPVKNSTKILHVTFLIFYWLLTVVVANLGNTFPYKSQILGI